jgi:hypothetical protein
VKLKLSISTLDNVFILENLHLMIDYFLHFDIHPLQVSKLYEIVPSGERVSLS